MSIPLIGFGTWQLTGDGSYDAVRAALDVGYRHIDTATGYSNEERVGAAVRGSGLGRQDVFITTKCPPGNVGREAQTLDASLKALGIDFVDLWLVHWPPTGEARPDTWRPFIKALEQGKTRATGVSNYSTAQIDELISATGRAPALNQIPWSPFAFDSRTVAGLRDRHVVLEGYSPLKRSDLGNPDRSARDRRVCPRRSPGLSRARMIFMASPFELSGGRVEDLAGPAVWLASPASDFVTGQVIYVDGGMTSVL